MNQRPKETIMETINSLFTSIALLAIVLTMAQSNPPAPYYYEGDNTHVELSPMVGYVMYPSSEITTHEVGYPMALDV